MVRSYVGTRGYTFGQNMITGIKTTIPFQQAIMQNSDFRRGAYHTGFVESLLLKGVPIVR